MSQTKTRTDPGQRKCAKFENLGKSKKYWKFESLYPDLNEKKSYPIHNILHLSWNLQGKVTLASRHTQKSWFDLSKSRNL